MARKNGSTKVLIGSIVLIVISAAVYWYGYSTQNYHIYEIAKEVIGAGLVGVMSAIIHKLLSING